MNLTADSRSLAERILSIEPVESDIFMGSTLPEAPTFGKVFGGQLVGQALASATETVDFGKLIHSLHANFMLPGDADMPIYYRVQRLRDGKSFATRRVDALQNGIIIFTLVASFQKEEMGLEHQIVTPPSVPDPDKLPSMEELGRKGSTDPRLHRRYRNSTPTPETTPWPVEVRFCEPANPTDGPPSMTYWFRANGRLPDDDALHRCVVAYASDLAFLSESSAHHGFLHTITGTSCRMWFHRPVRADEWILFVMFSPIAHAARGFVSGQMFNRKGELLVSLTQQGLLRAPRAPLATSAKISKL
uniref:Acyl-CoA thioesterase II n=1 Tax=Kalanchoe fedtschenkoi TaxID=63787 RepID=A0A7N0SZK0_KALFE